MLGLVVFFHLQEIRADEIKAEGSTRVASYAAKMASNMTTYNRCDERNEVVVVVY